jgi:hypothetical protein
MIRLDAVERKKDGSRPIEQRSSGVGQANATSVPDEQRRAEFTFQERDLTAERRLGDAQFRRRSCKGALSCNGDEIAKLLGIHVSAPAMPKRYISRKKSGLAIASAA